MSELVYPLLRKVTTVARNPRVVADKATSAVVDLVWSGRRRSRLLSTWQMPAARSKLEGIVFDRVFSRWIDQVYLAERDADRREALKDVCMAGRSGVSWAEVYDRRPIDRTERYGDLSFDEASPWFPAMDRALSSAPAQALVAQIGCSSGRELAHFAGRFPRLEFLGTDIDAQITERAARRHSSSNVTFRVARAHQLVDVLPIDRPLILYSSGSLAYVQPEHLGLTFRKIRARGNATLIVGEAWRDDGPEVGTPLTRWRGNFSYSHDYREYAEQARLKIQETALIQTHSDPSSPHFRTRHYYLWAAAGN